MRTALCQYRIPFEEKEKAIAIAKEYISKAKGCDIILFPEMSFTGFSMNIKATAEKDDYTKIIMSELAAVNNITIGYGRTVACGDKAYNRYEAVSPTGELIASYDKLHPFSYSGEDKYFHKGDKLSTFVCSDFRLGIQICYDLRFPEGFSCLSKFADAIIVPSCWPKQRAEERLALLKARAIENQLYIIAVNATGESGNILYHGESTVIDPKGRVLTELTDEEGLIISDIKNDTKKFRSEFPTVEDKRWELYKKLYEVIK